MKLCSGGEHGLPPGVRGEGATNADLTEVMNKVCAEYKCNMVEGVLSHKVMKYLDDKLPQHEFVQR